MKKLFLTAAIAALAFSSVASAEMQVSGNVTTLVGYQHDQGKAGVTGTTVLNTGGLTQGDFNWTNTASADHFGFSVPQAELDFENEFGENIMARIDVDLIDLGTPSASGVLLEQAYVTANLSVGNGMEFLIGKFNTPMGLENVDRHMNAFSTYTPGRMFLMPAQALGAKLYYEFNDTWNMDIAAVNQLNDSMLYGAGAWGGNSALPSGLLRVGANWGDEGNQSTFNIAAAFGPEQSGVTGGSNNKHYDMLGDIWGVFAVSDAWDIGLEGTYRQTNGIGGGASNTKAFAAQLYALYEASDAWTVQFRGHWFDEVNAAGTSYGASTTGAGWSGNVKGHDFGGTLGATYTITDDAKMTLEYRGDYYATGDGTANPMFHTGVAQFAYSF